MSELGVDESIDVGVERNDESALPPWSMLDQNDIMPSQDSNRLANCEDIKDQLNLIVNEIRSLHSRIDEIDASGYQMHGFDVHNTLKKRKEKLTQSTKPGRAPDKPSILFVSFIIEALKEGAKSERGIKDFVIEQCKKHRLKSYRGGIVAGTHLDVGNVCAVLAGIGFLENYQSTTVSSDQTMYSLKSNNMTNELCRRWGIVIEDDDPSLQRIPSTITQPLTVDQKNTITSPIDQLSKASPYSPLGSWLRAEMEGEPKSAQKDFQPSQLEEQLLNSEHRPRGKIQLESGEEDMDALSADHMDLEFDFVGNDRIETDSPPGFQPALNFDADLVKDESTNVDSKSATNKKGSGSTKMWKISDNVRQGDKSQIVTNPEQFFESFMSKAFEHQALLEVEEKLLRYVANQCKMDLPEAVSTCTTKYLDVTLDDELPPGKPAESSNSTTVDIAETMSVDAIPVKDLFDENCKMTADYLLNKVMRTKRQRGTALTSNVSASSPTNLPSNTPYFSMSHIDNLKEVVDKTIETYWMVDEQNKPLKKKRSNSTTQSEKMTLVEFARSTNTTFSNSSLSNYSFSNVLLAGETPTVTMPLWKHYVPMLSVYDDQPQYVVSTVEIPWSSVATEFQPVGIDDCEANGVVVGVVDFDKTVEVGTRAPTSTDHHNTGGPTKISVVEAPLFHIVDRTALLSQVQEDDSGSEEDISDEAMLRRHEQVLRRMREKWALMQKLKSEARRDSVGGIPQAATSKKNPDTKSPPLKVAEVEPKVSMVDHNKNNNDPDSGSDNQVKRRGRPPKTTKFSHYGRY